MTREKAYEASKSFAESKEYKVYAEVYKVYKEALDASDKAWDKYIESDKSWDEYNAYEEAAEAVEAVEEAAYEARKKAYKGALKKPSDEN